MSPNVELGLVVLYRATTEDIDVTQIASNELDQGRFSETDPVRAIEGLAEALDLTTAADRYAGATALVLALRLALDAPSAALDTAVDTLTAALLEHLVDPADAVEGAPSLVAAITRLLNDPAVSPDVQADLVEGFRGALAIAPASATTVAMSGPAAAMATMLVELATLDLRCRSSEHQVDIGGTTRDVTLVEIEVCTVAPFDRCRRGIDPRHWPACNPYFFQSVIVVAGSPQPTGPWSGVVRETVGPGLNGSTYTTNLAVTYHEQPAMASVAYDLAPPDPAVPEADPRVLVDHGFVSVSDEGPHRRFRVLKAYSIDDLSTPHSWVCPLWAQQVAMSGWWC